MYADLHEFYIQFLAPFNSLWTLSVCHCVKAQAHFIRFKGLQTEMLPETIATAQ